MILCFVWSVSVIIRWLCSVDIYSFVALHDSEDEDTCNLQNVENHTSHDITSHPRHTAVTVHILLTTAQVRRIGVTAAMFTKYTQPELQSLLTHPLHDAESFLSS